MRCCLVVCAVFFDVYANCIDPGNASLYEDTKGFCKGEVRSPWQQAHRIIHL